MNEPTKLKQVDKPVDADVVDVLEFLLKEAKAGNVIALAGIAVRVGQEHEQFWIGKAPLSHVMFALDCWKFKRLQQTINEADAVLKR